MNMNNTSFKGFPRLPECVTHFQEDTVGGINGILLTTIYSINMVFIVVFNTLLIIGICKTRKKNKFTNSNKLFLFLCASDLSAGCILMPMQIYFIHITPDVSCLQTAVRAFWSSFPLLLSGNNILVISIDRYIMMSKNKFYRKYFTSKCIVGYIAVEFAISFAWALWYVFTIESIDKEDHTKFYISLSAYELLILLAVIIFNFKMLFSVKRAQKNTTLSYNNTEQVLSKTIAMISFALVICYIPSIIGLAVTGLFLHYTTDLEQIRVITIVLIWSLVPTQINSALNAMIYLIRNSRIRKFYMTAFLGSSGDSLTDTNDSLASHKDLHRLSTKKNYRTYHLTKQDSSSSKLYGESNQNIAKTVV